MEPKKTPTHKPATTGAEPAAQSDGQGLTSDPASQGIERRSIPRAYDDGNEYEVDPLGDDHDYPASSSDLFYEG